MPRRFYVSTYGCQMNEHDSQRIAGLLVDEGCEPADGLDDADIVVLNTCCIRENADNKLYGHLGRLKALKAEKPGLQIAVGGCLAQKDRELIVERAGHVDVVFGTHNLAHAPTLLAESARRGEPVVEILEEHEAYPSALPVSRDVDHRAWVTIQIGCDNSCAFCIVPSVRGAEVSRRMGDVVREVQELVADGVVEITLLGQNVNSYGRDLGAGQWRPEFADLLRAVDAVDGLRRVRFTSPHPKDQRPETVAAMAELDSVCEHLHLPLQSGSDRTLARMRRGYTAERYLARLEAARAAIPDLAVTTDLIVGFPGETDEDFERTLEVVDAASYDAAYTFVFSPRPGTAAADMVDDFVPDEVVKERFARLEALLTVHAELHHGQRVGLIEEILIEGPSKKDPDVMSGRTRQNKLVHVAAPAGVALTPGTFADVRITAAADHWLRGELLEVTAAAPPRRIRIPVTAGVEITASHLALVGPTASGKSALGLEVARAFGDVEIVSMDSMQIYRGMDIGTATPSAAERASVAHHLVDVADPWDDWSVARFQTEARAAIADIEARGKRALLLGGTGLYVQAVVDDLRFPGEDLVVRSELAARAAEPDGLAEAYAELERVDPDAAARIEPTNARRIVRALEVIQITGQPFSSFGPGLGEYGATVFPVSMVGVWIPRPVLRDRIAARFATMRAAGLVEEVQALAADPRGWSRTARQAIGYKEIVAHLDGEEPSLEAALEAAVRRTRLFARRQRVWFRRDPRITWFGAPENSCDLLPALLARWCA